MPEPRIFPYLKILIGICTLQVPHSLKHNIFSTRPLAAITSQWNFKIVEKHFKYLHWYCVSEVCSQELWGATGYIYIAVKRDDLKGQCHEIFECWFFASNWSSWSPQRYPATIQFFAKNSWRYSNVKSFPRYQYREVVNIFVNISPKNKLLWDVDLGPRYYRFMKRKKNLSSKISYYCSFNVLEIIQVFTYLLTDLEKS